MMKRLTPAFWLGTTLVAFLFGYSIGPARSAAQQNQSGQAAGSGQPAPLGGALPPGDYSRMLLAPVLDIPPSVPHATLPDAGGMTYVLMKVNVGLYPWSLINGTP